MPKQQAGIPACYPSQAEPSSSTYFLFSLYEMLISLMQAWLRRECGLYYLNSLYPGGELQYFLLIFPDGTRSSVRDRSKASSSCGLFSNSLMLLLPCSRLLLRLRHESRDRRESQRNGKHQDPDGITV